MWSVVLCFLANLFNCTISPIPEEPSEVIQINKIHEMHKKELTIFN